jgi:hypothetical protein
MATPTHEKRDRGGDAMVYGVLIQTLDRHDGNGITMLFVEATDAIAAEMRARAIAHRTYHCEVVTDHAVECPGFAPTLAYKRPTTPTVRHNRRRSRRSA